MSRKSLLLIALGLLLAGAVRADCPPPGPANWCSGTCQYDGSGNIKAIGADTYTYDEFGRLKSGTADVQRGNVTSQQTYTYDPFGNRLTASRTDGSVGCVGGARSRCRSARGPADTHLPIVKDPPEKQ